MRGFFGAGKIIGGDRDPMSFFLFTPEFLGKYANSSPIPNLGHSHAHRIQILRSKLSKIIKDESIFAPKHVSGNWGKIPEMYHFMVDAKRRKVDKEETFRQFRAYKFKTFPVNCKMVDPDILLSSDVYKNLHLKYACVLPKLREHVKKDHFLSLVIDRSRVPLSHCLASLQYFWEKGQFSDHGNIGTISREFFNNFWRRSSLPFFVLHSDMQSQFYLLVDPRFLDYYKTHCASLISYKSLSCLSYMPICRQFVHPNYPLFIDPSATPTKGGGGPAARKYNQRLKIYFSLVWLLIRLVRERSFNIYSLSCFLLDPSLKTENILWSHYSRIQSLIELLSYGMSRKEILRETYQWHINTSTSWRKRKPEQLRNLSKRQKTETSFTRCKESCSDEEDDMESDDSSSYSANTYTEGKLEKIVGLLTVQKRHYVTFETYQLLYALFFSSPLAALSASGPAAAANSFALRALSRKYPAAAMAIQCIHEVALVNRERKNFGMIDIVPPSEERIRTKIKARMNDWRDPRVREDLGIMERQIVTDALKEYESQASSMSLSDSSNSSSRISLSMDPALALTSWTKPAVKLKLSDITPLQKYINSLERRQLQGGLMANEEEDMVHLSAELMTISLYEICLETTIPIEKRRQILAGIVTFNTRTDFKEKEKEEGPKKVSSYLEDYGAFSALLSSYNTMYEQHLDPPLEGSTLFYKPVKLPHVPEWDPSFPRNTKGFSSLHLWFASVDLYHLYFTYKNVHMGTTADDFAETKAWSDPEEEGRVSQHIGMHPVIPYNFSSQSNKFILNPCDGVFGTLVLPGPWKKEEKRPCEVLMSEPAEKNPPKEQGPYPQEGNEQTKTYMINTNVTAKKTPRAAEPTGPEIIWDLDALLFIRVTPWLIAPKKDDISDGSLDENVEKTVITNHDAIVAQVYDALLLEYLKKLE